jgi:NAD(P)H dehydrogenase (quinone)
MLNCQTNKNINDKGELDMGKLLLTGVDGNLGGIAADVLLTLEPAENLIFCGYSEEALKKYAAKGVDTRQTNFNNPDGLAEAFKGADALALISMPFVGVKRQNAHKNAVDAAKAAGVKQIVYTSLVNADDETNPSVEKKDHIYTEKYIKEVGLDYQFMRNSQYAEAMVTNYFTYVKMGQPLTNSQGDGKMAYISRVDCAKAVAYALHRSSEFHNKIWNINGPQLMTITEFINYGNEATGNNLTFKNVTDEENYAIWDAMGVPRTTDGVFKKDSEAPFSSDGMVTFAQAIREGKMDIFTDDYKKLTGLEPVTVKYMFEHQEDYQIGERHSKDN